MWEERAPVLEEGGKRGAMVSGREGGAGSPKMAARARA